MWVAWHIGAAAGTFEQWLDQDEFTKSVMRHELTKRIEAHNAPAENNRK